VTTNYINKVSIQPAPAVYLLATGKPSLSILRYLIHFLSLCSFVNCGFRVRFSSSVRVTIIGFLCRLKKQKLAVLEKWVPYSQRYLFNAIPDTNHNANATNPNRYSKGNPTLPVRC